MAASLRRMCACNKLAVFLFKHGIYANVHLSGVQGTLKSFSKCLNINFAKRNKARYLSCWLDTHPKIMHISTVSSMWLSNKILHNINTFASIPYFQLLKHCCHLSTKPNVPKPSDKEINLDRLCTKSGSQILKDTIQTGEEKPSDEFSVKKENIKTIPNLLTLLRMTSAPLLGYLVVCENFTWALSIFTLAGVSDLLDGFIARNFKNQISVLGSVLDPLADKLLVTVLTVSMTAVGLIPLPLTLLIVSRDCSLIAGGFYIRYISLPSPITLSRYFDISYATAKIFPTFISKLNTGLQLLLVASSLAAPVFGFVDHLYLQALWYTTGSTTFLSGVDYLWSWKKHVVLLEKDQKDL